MAACPNCGRQTLRTKDWACQWCGYPLISRAFKTIDKTFKELQEERSLNIDAAESGLEPESESEYEPEYEPEPEPEPEPKPKPQKRPIPRPKPEPESESEPAPRPPVRPVPKPTPAPEPAPAPEPEPVIEAPPMPKPEIRIEPAPPPEPPIKLETIQDGMEITADQMDTLYRVEKAGAHSKFTGKTLVIKGVVEKVFVREHLDIRYIMLTGSRQKAAWSIRCTFGPGSSSRLTGLNEGQEIVVRGKYEGYSKNIIFKDCELV